MIDFKVAQSTTVLLVDDDIRHLELRTIAIQMSGFSVVNATSPLEAISTVNEASSSYIHVAVLDYDIPVMTGCLLADYLKSRYPKLRTILYSGSVDIPEDECVTWMCSFLRAVVWPRLWRKLLNSGQRKRYRAIALQWNRKHFSMHLTS